MAEHTPTPWDVDGVYVERKGDERLVTLANCCHSPRIDIPTAKANAAFIVKAVNAHDELVSTLEWVRANYASGPTAEINARIDAALAKAS